MTSKLAQELPATMRDIAATTTSTTARQVWIVFDYKIVSQDAYVFKGGSDPLAIEEWLGHLKRIF